MEEKKNVQTTAAAPAKKKGFIDVFLDGGKRGVNMWLNGLVPGAIVGYLLTQILQVSGIMTVLGKVFSPIMGIFNLPGEAVACIMTSFFSLVSSCASAAALATNGVMSGEQIAIICPMLVCVGSGIQFLGRMLSVADVPGKQYGVNLVISVICAAIAGLLMRVILGV